jgi:hypothetical protein
MEEGVGRRRQITEVIDRSEFMMLVMSRLGADVGGGAAGVAIRAAAAMGLRVIR